MDFNYVDETTGLTNLERMQNGKPPISPDGNPVQLHHILQKESGPMVEIQEITHQEYFSQLHGLAEDGASFRNNPILNKQYNNFRNQYWKWRASQFNGG
ncbi:MAG: HNH/ENDO VII family nuclease [Breznakia sp.]